MNRRASRSATLLLGIGLLVGCTPADGEPGSEPVSLVVDADSGEPAVDVAHEVPARLPFAGSPQPSSIKIPELDIRGSVQPVGFSAPGTMQVPADISVVGWFDRSAFPIGERGHTVLVGHRDGVDDPNGIFRRLGDVRRGDRVIVRDLAGRRVRYEVESVDVLGTKEFADRAAQLFSVTASHRLVLLSCGGVFDRSRGGYQATVVVIATRA